MHLGIRAAITVATVTALAEPAQAQRRPGVELAGGYQLLRLQSEPLTSAVVGTFIPFGWFFEAAAPVSSGFTLVGQLGGHYRSESASGTFMAGPTADDYRLNVHTVLAGPRVIGRREDGLTAFFHLLAGATRVGLTRSGSPLESTTDLTLQAGGGFDFPLTSQWSGRMTADYVRVFTERLPTHGVRVAVGWVVPLAR